MTYYQWLHLCFQEDARRQPPDRSLLKRVLERFRQRPGPAG